ncbi:MAG: hypothetical protein ABFC31_00560 [Clostridiaceae bacterium]
METKVITHTKPKRLCVLVTEQGKQTVNVRMPYFMFKMGMKFGKTAAKNGDITDCGDAMAYLEGFDAAELERSLESGEQALPLVLVDVDEPEKNGHVIVTLE